MAEEQKLRKKGTDAKAAQSPGNEGEQEAVTIYGKSFGEKVNTDRISRDDGLHGRRDREYVLILCLNFAKCMMVNLPRHQGIIIIILIKISIY